MTREGLALELRSVITAAKRKRKPVRKEGVRVTVHGHTRDLTLKATPISGGAAGSSHVMVVFESATPVPRAPRSPTKNGRGKGHASGAETEIA
jgi:hypothetical protein